MRSGLSLWLWLVLNIPREGNSWPPQYSCLENPMDRRAWWATALGSQRVRYDGVTKHKHPNTNDAEHITNVLIGQFEYLLWRNVYLDPLSTFKLGYLFLLLSFRILNTNLLLICKYFLPFCGRDFWPSWKCSLNTNIFTFEVQFISFSLWFPVLLVPYLRRLA